MLKITAPPADSLDGRRLRAELAASGLVVTQDDMHQSDRQVVFPTLTASDEPAVRQALSQHMSRPEEADPDTDLAASINAVDTSKITDAATKTAINALKSALLGSGKPAAVSGRPTGR